MSISRSQLIKVLTSRYDYPRSWFESLATCVLYAIYLKPVREKIRLEQVEKCLEAKEPKDVFRINHDTGDKEVLTDSGQWEVYCD